MHDSPSRTYLQWVLAERLARQAAAKFMDRAAWPTPSTAPADFPTREIVAILRAIANGCLKELMAELDARAVTAARRGMAVQIRRDRRPSNDVDPGPTAE